MDIKLIIAICIVLVVGVSYGVKIFILNKKKDPSEIDSGDILEQYIDQIIQTGAKLISILQLNKEDYSSIEEYNLALASHTAIEIKAFINDSDIPSYIMDVLSIEIITQFILKIFEINRGKLYELANEEAELFKINFMNSIKQENEYLNNTSIYGENTISLDEVYQEDNEMNIEDELNEFYNI